MAVGGLLLFSCEREIEKFTRPEWLEGKLFTQLEQVPEVDSFANCLRITGYDTLINASGSYTIFAPDNSAMNDYLGETGYSSFTAMPVEEVQKLVRTHIVQNPWSKEQLQMLDVTGWINPEDPNNDEPWGYKRQTLMKDGNRRYFIKIERNVAQIVDSTESNILRTVYPNSRKYLPIFFDEYMDIAQLNSADYEFYFERPYEPGQIYYSGAKLDPEDYFAENGFIYRIDKVVEPLQNAEQLIQNSTVASYKRYLDAIYLFPLFYENEEETFKQPGAEEGLDVPTLYDLDFENVTFDIHEELTGRENVNTRNTIRYHYGILPPTDEAMTELIDDVMTGGDHWASYNQIPENIKLILVNSHMAINPIYQSDLEYGFINGEKDSVLIDPDDVIEKHYGSNATFLGLKKAIVPRAFTSVSGPVYLRPGFETYMNAIEFSKILPAIKRSTANYGFFVLDDEQLKLDSSLFISRDLINPRIFQVTSYEAGTPNPLPIRRTEFEMNLQMLNQVATDLPSGMGRKEFIPNLAGNYIVYNNEDYYLYFGTDSIFVPAPSVTGGAPSYYGYQPVPSGDSVIGITPVRLEEPTDNGETYQVNGWFYFPRNELNTTVSTYSRFYQVIVAAGLRDIFLDFTFTTPSEKYTILMPTNEAMEDSVVVAALDNMSKAEKEQFVLNHFIPGNMIFTDGKMPSGKYETLARDEEASTIYNTVYRTVDLRTSVDRIEILDESGGVISTIDEEQGRNNILTAINLYEDDNNYDYWVTNGVIHEIDTVLIR